MGNIMQTLFGSAPKATDQPTTTAAQQSLLASTAGGLQTGQLAPGATPYAGPTAAGLSGLETTSLAGLENIAGGLTGTTGASPQQTSDVSQALTSFNKLLTAPTPTIDPTAAFETGVVQPLTSDFTQYTIPAINAQYGKGAGAGYSSDALAAREQAGTNLARTLSQTGSQYQLGAQQANQQAALTQMDTITKLLGISPNITGLPGATASSNISPLSSLLTAGQIPQQVAQTQVQGDWQNYLNTINQSNQLYQLASGLSTAQTMQPGSTGGSTGLLTGLLSNLGSTGGGGGSGGGGGGGGASGLLGLASLIGLL